jgi:hypothetical protein
MTYSASHPRPRSTSRKGVPGRAVSSVR